MATVPTLDSFTAGEKLLAAKLNRNIRDPLSFLLNPPRATMAINGAAFSIPTTAYTTIAFDAETLDTDGMIDIVGFSPSGMKVQTPGTYDLAAMVSYGANATGIRGVRITVDNVAVVQDWRPATSTAGLMVAISATNVPLVVGNVIRLVAYQNSTVALTTSTTVGERPFLTARWVCA